MAHVVFYSTHFSGKKTHFDSVHFYSKSDFATSHFEEDVDFLSTKFFEETDFSSTQFLGHALFNNSYFRNNTKFDSALFEKTTDFTETEFENEVNFDKALFNLIAKFNKSKINEANILNIYFKFPVDFSDSEIEKIDLTGTVFNAYAVFNNCDIKNADRNTFRIIKHELIRNNNRLDTVIYHKKEMEAFRKELNENKNNKYSTLKKYQELFVLFINRWSNNYGTSWLRGFGFTFIIAFIFFFLLVQCGLNERYFAWGWDNWSSFWDVCDMHLSYFFKFISPTHGFEFDGIKLSGIGYFIDFISRIAIGFGYFQIIQAFRKYKIW
ncbi:MAG: hypothetical protein HW421_2750 [Ignavibacteria bacterium]|nr:hypothetical protein [Ignavibacteria bacterium]